MKKTKTDIQKIINKSKSIEVFAFNNLTDDALAIRLLKDAVKYQRTIIILA